MNHVGYSQTRWELTLTIKKILDDDRRPNPFKDNIPGPHWFKAFLRRHPAVTERVGEALGKERAMVTVEKLENWFKDFQEYMTSDETVGATEILTDGNRIFNCDESGFPLAGKNEKVLAPRGTKNIYQFSTSDKRQITVLACMNATGYFVKPMLIFPNSRFRYNPLESAPEDWCIGRSSNGWINSEVFYEWLANHFLPSVKQRGIPFPVLLLIDGHSSHISFESATFCKENDIILYCLPAHSSHILQPCNLTLFGSLKGTWKGHVKDCKSQNIDGNITKLNFASVFAKAWAECTSPEKELSPKGFRAAGLFPLNPLAFDREKLAPSTIFGQARDVSQAASASSGFQSSDSVSKNSDAKTALRVLEDTFTEEKKWLYNRRLREGWDIETDELYNTWKLLKTRSETSNNNNSKDNNSNSNNCNNNSNSSNDHEDVNEDDNSAMNPFDKHLRFPSCSNESSKKKQQREALPHAISGRAFIKYLSDKKKEKEQAERKKEENRKKREATKAEKEAKARRKERAQKEGTDAEDDDIDEEEGDAVDQNKCAKCVKEYDGNEERWVGCETCDRWFHKECTDIEGAIYMSNSELNELDWVCEYCTEE